MATDVVMPQMGESIAEGTIVRWIKKVGDTVDRDEPLFEISTDKVDAEIPSPAAGVLTEIRVKEGETVAGQQRRRGDWRRAARRLRPRLAPQPRHGRRPPPARRSRDGAPRQPPPTSHVSRADDAPPPRRPRRRGRGAANARRRPATRAGGQSCDRRRDPRSARRRWCARSRRSTTSTSRRSTAPGIGGPRHQGRHPRVHREGGAAIGRGRRSAARRGRRRRRRAPRRRTVRRHRDVQAGASDHVETMSVMRKRIAEHMVLEPADVGARALGVRGELPRVAKIREAKKAEYERAGAKLTYLSFIIKAVDRRAARGAGRQRVGRRRQRSSITRTSTSASRSRSTGD